MFVRVSPSRSMRCGFTRGGCVVYCWFLDGLHMNRQRDECCKYYMTFLYCSIPSSCKSGHTISSLLVIRPIGSESTCIISIDCLSVTPHEALILSFYEYSYLKLSNACHYC